ncbi:hypothetical protein [Kocuria nitroreducens]|uniref:hypothetical protein n=1 Tax=Kocuria nitroreducens TaxID=3058914 RepID=UPI0036D87E22
MTISGPWVLHFSWGCTDDYGRVGLVFNADGSFSGGGFSGAWRQHDGTLLLRFVDGPAQYGGTLTGSAGAGAMSSFDGSPGGCWYLVRRESAGWPDSADSSAGQPADVAGRRLDSAGTAPGELGSAGTAPGELDAAGNRI